MDITDGQVNKLSKNSVYRYSLPQASRNEIISENYVHRKKSSLHILLSIECIWKTGFSDYFFSKKYRSISLLYTIYFASERKAKKFFHARIVDHNTHEQTQSEKLNQRESEGGKLQIFQFRAYKKKSGRKF